VKTILVQVNDTSTSQLRVVWSEWRPYTISKQTIEDCAEDIRSVLLELVNHCLKNGPEAAAPILKKLARKGSELYQALFLKVGGEEDPSSIKDDIAAAQEQLRIDFRVDDHVLIPWGLIYPANPELLPDSWEGIPETDRWQAYRDFWCFAHDATVRHIGVLPSRIRHASPPSMLRVVHPTVFEKAKAQVNSPYELGFIDWLDTRYHMPISAELLLEKSWRDRGAEIGLLYFYCHASPKKLAIGPDDSISSTKLLLLLTEKKRPPGAGCLVLINGCRTAAGDSRGSFMLSSSMEGFVGFVGAETDIPDVFALRFSTALLHLLFKKGKTLGEAMHQLYRDHFPLSLVYSVYAHPCFRVMPQPGIPDIERQRNFSVGVIGTPLEARDGL
jgi:hypothetical protein